MIKSVRFPAEHFDTDAEEFVIEEQIFSIGDTVTRVEAVFLETVTSIEVFARNGSKRAFVYMNTAIMGAIEIEEFTPIEGSGNVIAFPSK